MTEYINKNVSERNINNLKINSILKCTAGIVNNHIYHHRGQLTVYLRLLDLPVPGIYGPSADEK